MVDISSYLARIHYAGPTAPTLGTLCAIHHAHMLTVPFENLDISMGRKIVLDEDALLRKIVEQRRGGFCYEMNGAFAALLRQLGFAVTLLSARVSRENGGEGPEFDHLALRIDLPEDESWLADVGFGDSFLKPLRLKTEIEHADPAGVFRVVRFNQHWQMEKLYPSAWRQQYSFTLQPRQLSDFAGMCHYHQTSPETSFTQNTICTRATPEGRITLSGLKLIQTQHGRREEKLLTTEEERVAVLREHFGIELPPESR
jgi:N-hydroxyarylamine O-acetyltransferase